MHKWYQDTDCPGKWLSQRFGQLANEVNAILGGAPEPSPEPELHFGGCYECMVQALNVRTKPSLSGDVVAEYHYGEIVWLDDWFCIEDGYVWGRYTGNQSGKLRYVAIGRDTGKVEDDDYLMKIGG
jgi:hypothetical protein